MEVQIRQIILQLMEPQNDELKKQRRDCQKMKKDLNLLSAR